MKINNVLILTGVALMMLFLSQLKTLKERSEAIVEQERVKLSFYQLDK